MKTDDNWRKVRLLSDDIELITGKSKNEIEYLFSIFEDLSIHKFIEEVSKEEDPRGKDYEIVLPYIGSLVISINEKGKLTTNFVQRPAFFHDLRKYYNTRKSPLVKTLSDELGKTLSERYDEGQEDLLSNE